MILQMKVYDLCKITVTLIMNDFTAIIELPSLSDPFDNMESTVASSSTVSPDVVSVTQTPPTHPHQDKQPS